MFWLLESWLFEAGQTSSWHNRSLVLFAASSCTPGKRGNVIATSVRKHRLFLTLFPGSWKVARQPVGWHRLIAQRCYFTSTRCRAYPSCATHSPIHAELPSRRWWSNERSWKSGGGLGNTSVWCGQREIPRGFDPIVTTILSWWIRHAAADYTCGHWGALKAYCGWPLGKTPFSHIYQDRPLANAHVHNDPW